MIKCHSLFAYCDRCVADMDSQQSLEGRICCDIADDMSFDKEDITKYCPYAEQIVELPFT